MIEISQRNKISVMSLIVWASLMLSFASSLRSLIKPSSYQHHAVLYSHASLAIDQDGENSNFDSDFADAMSKPLPQWFKEQKEEQDRHLKELEKNRDRIMLEFKKKYEVIDEEKIKEYEIKLANKSKKPSWLTELFVGASKVELDENDEKTTKQKWKEFLVEEQKATGLTFPGFFEVFPELKAFKWPIWAKSKSGSVIKCETDQDCQFPQACCPHPILPGDKFCCTGFGRRAMVPAYATRRITSSPAPSSPN